MSRPAGQTIDWSRYSQRIWNGRCGEVRFMVLRLSVRRHLMMIVAPNPPRWVLWSLADAQRRAQEIADSSPVTGPAGEIRWPIVELKRPYRQMTEQPEMPEWMPACPRCRWRSRPVAVQAINFTPEFWEDPSPFWRCRNCDGRICDLEGIEW